DAYPSGYEAFRPSGRAALEIRTGPNCQATRMLALALPDLSTVNVPSSPKTLGITPPFRSTAKITPLRHYKSRTGFREILNSVFWGCPMNMDDGQLIARFQRLTTELLIEK